MKNLISQLFVKKYSKLGCKNYGLIATKVVTTAFFELFVDALQSNIDLSTFNFHDSGIGTTAAVIGDTDLETKVESGRETGTQEEENSITYKSVAEIDYTATREITEHGIFSAPSGGTLLDRSVFDFISVVDENSIEYTYLFNPTGVTAEIELLPCANLDLATLTKIEQLNQYIRTLAPALYALGLDSQNSEIFQRQLSDLSNKISILDDDGDPTLEDSDQARRNKELYEQEYRGT